MANERHILLVDDEEDIIEFLERFLKRLKITSTKATSGEAALKLYDKGRMNCVFLDIHLNGIDGFTVLKELKKMNPSVRVIIIAGSADRDAHQRAAELGAVDYITKPLVLSELKEKIDRYFA